MDYKKIEEMLNNKFENYKTWVRLEQVKNIIKKDPSKYTKESLNQLIAKEMSHYKAHKGNYEKYKAKCSKIISEGIKIFLFLKWPVPQELSLYRKSLGNKEYILISSEEFHELALLSKHQQSSRIRRLSLNRLEIEIRKLLISKAQKVLREKQVSTPTEISSLKQNINSYKPTSQPMKFISLEDIKNQLNESVGPLSEKKYEDELKKYQDMEKKNREDMLQEYKRVRNELGEELRNLDMVSDEVIENILDDNMEDIEKDILSNRIVGMVKQKEGLPPPEYTFEAVMESRMSELKTRLVLAKNGIAKEKQNLKKNVKDAQIESTKRATK